MSRNETETERGMSECCRLEIGLNIYYTICQNVFQGKTFDAFESERRRECVREKERTEHIQILDSVSRMIYLSALRIPSSSNNNTEQKEEDTKVS